MDVKSASLNGVIKYKVYVEPKDFEDPNFLNHMMQLKITLYGLNQVFIVYSMNVCWFLFFSTTIFKEVEVTRPFYYREKGKFVVADIIFVSTKDDLA